MTSRHIDWQYEKRHIKRHSFKPRKKIWGAYLVAVELLILALGLAYGLSLLTAHAEEPTCRTNKECCEAWAAGEFINGRDNEIARLCAEYL